MIKVIGHRGAAGHALENTFASFEKARGLGVDMFETDIQMTLDGQLVIFHDNILDRITDGHGYLADYTYKELRSIKLQDGSEIILLEDLCKYCRDIKMPLFAEVKNSGIAEIVIKTLLKYFNVNDFIIGSFFHKQIHELKQVYPKVSTCIIFEGILTEMMQYIYKFPVDFVSFGFESFNDNIFSELKQSKINYMFWTLNLETEINKAIAYEPYAIISNYPEKILKHISAASMPTTR